MCDVTTGMNQSRPVATVTGLTIIAIYRPLPANALPSFYIYSDLTVLPGCGSVGEI